MERFIARQNISHFKELLAKAEDPVERERLGALLAEAEQQLVDIERDAHTPTSEGDAPSRSPDGSSRSAD